MQQNDNLIGVDDLTLEELEEYRNQLQDEAFTIKNSIALKIAEQGERADKVWIAKAEKARSFKTSAINRINIRLGKLKRAEIQRQQKTLEATFMRVTQRELGDEWFTRLIRLAQIEAGI